VRGVVPAQPAGLDRWVIRCSPSSGGSRNSTARNLPYRAAPVTTLPASAWHRWVERLTALSEATSTRATGRTARCRAGGGRASTSGSSGIIHRFAKRTAACPGVPCVRSCEPRCASSFALLPPRRGRSRLGAGRCCLRSRRRPSTACAPPAHREEPTIQHAERPQYTGCARVPAIPHHDDQPEDEERREDQHGGAAAAVDVVFEVVTEARRDLPMLRPHRPLRASRADEPSRRSFLPSCVRARDRSFPQRRLIGRRRRGRNRPGVSRANSTSSCREKGGAGASRSVVKSLGGRGSVVADQVRLGVGDAFEHDVTAAAAPPC